MSTTQIINVQAKIQWHVTKTNEGNYVGICQPLNITMEGSSFEELDANIGDSLQLLLLDLLRDGELERFLRAQGWRVSAQPRPNEKVEFAVPFELLVQSSRDPARAIH